jgi:hypothetical protein
MPVEIKELVIRAVVNPESENNQVVSESNQPIERDEAIIRECVRQVMSLLKKKEER